MRIVDLSRELYHRTPSYPGQPPIIHGIWKTHEEAFAESGNVQGNSVMFFSMPDHGGTHIDAPRHFDEHGKTVDEVPLEQTILPGHLLDLTHRNNGEAITIADLEAAEKAAGIDIRPKDTVLLHMDFYRRAFGTEGYITDFPGLTKESATWLGKKGITMFGVEAASPGRPGRNNFEVHHVCRDLGFTHMEGLMNMEQLVGKGRFRFIGFPLKIKGGTGSPIRAVAWLDA